LSVAWTIVDISCPPVLWQVCTSSLFPAMCCAVHFLCGIKRLQIALL
jgi:hypothetical protein